MDKTITLTQEEWDRIIELVEFSGHTDSPHLLNKICNQLSYNPADQQATL